MFNTSKDFENYVPDTPSLIKVKAKDQAKFFFKLNHISHHAEPFVCKFDTDLYAFLHLFGLLLHECTSSKYTKFSSNKVHYHNRLCQQKKFSLTSFCQGLKLHRNQSIDCQCRGLASI